MKILKFTGLLIAVAMGALFTSGCVIDEASGQASTLQQNTQKAFTPYEMNLAQRALFNVTTQFVDRVVSVTNTVTNTVEKVVTNTVEHTIEKAVAVPVPSGFITNTVKETQIVDTLSTQTVAQVSEIVSNMHQRIVADFDVRVKPMVQGGVAATNIIPVWGQVVSVGLSGVLGLFAAYTKRRLNQSHATAKTFSQEIEAGMELLRNLSHTPQGQLALEKYKNWLQSHQSAAGVLDMAKQLVDEHVDNDDAKYVASLIAGRPQIPTPVAVQPQS